MTRCCWSSNKRLFSLLSYELETAVNGKESVEQSKKNIPDLILLDIMMPVMSGIETLKILKKNPDTKAIPVIMLTNN